MYFSVKVNGPPKGLGMRKESWEHSRRRAGSLLRAVMLALLLSMAAKAGDFLPCPTDEQQVVRVLNLGVGVNSNIASNTLIEHLHSL